ncbi:uncharacterized protein LOC121781707 [Salvia splendens]|uniref:uncharacterized protein LOC121781707 n=1 Tax=Salvia splendens TaxID=180675 RepID=UPI001C252056|nr:uncharacterized protein LOC121781707 [Salvia splendens]
MDSAAGETVGETAGDIAGDKASRIIGVDTKNLIAQSMLQGSRLGKIPYGGFVKTAKDFGVSRKTVHRIWAEASKQIQRGEPVSIKDRVKGFKRNDSIKLDQNRVRSLSVLERSTIRKMAFKLDLSKSTVGRMVKCGALRPHTNAVKPVLTAVNKVSRMKWALTHVQHVVNNGMLKYHSMHNVVHIDEKWFFVTKTTDRYYLLPDEEEPYRACKSKRFITKVMFMCAVCRPYFGDSGNVIFDGKIAILPFTRQEPAMRKSKNRPRGTLETKPIQSVNKDVMRECLIHKIIPAIKVKWPNNISKDIFIQQDNDRPHIMHNDAEFQSVANTDGFRFHIICQPSNSPDCNVLDLGFFRAIQSIQDDKLARGVDELVANVQAAFDELSAGTLNNVFLTLQGCLTEILKEEGGNGGNGYKTPHINKERLTRLGILPKTLEVEEHIVKAAVTYLQQPEHNEINSYDISNISTAVGF